jgi:hypothetical protein
MSYLESRCPLDCQSKRNYDGFDFEHEELEDIVLLNCPGCKQNLAAMYKQGSKAGNEYIKKHFRPKYGLE